MALSYNNQHTRGGARPVPVPENVPARSRSPVRPLPLFLISVGMALFAGSCDFPYAPQREPPPGNDKAPSSFTSGFSGGGTVYPVNVSEQSCNPSIAPGGPLNGCMLFLGFDALGVSVADSLAPEWPAQIQTHDRLMIVDAANTVRWFLMRTDLDSSGDLQCPEWTSSSDYLACLAGRIGKPYSGYAVRISDKKPLRIARENLEEFSTPHLWVAETTLDSVNSAAWYDDHGFADRASIESYFGTSKVKYVFSLPSRSGSLYFVDYSREGTPSMQQLAKPAGRENWYGENPLISPDGNWVAYHCFSNPTMGPLYSSYIQRLADGSAPVLIAEGGSDPHWWTDPFTGEYHLIYTVTYHEYYTGYPFTDPDIEKKNIAGCTLKQRLTGTWQKVPAHVGALARDTTFPPDTLLRLPFKGGLSHDGYYLATAYKYAYIAKLNSE